MLVTTPIGVEKVVKININTKKMGTVKSYFIGTTIAFLVLLCVIWFYGSAERFKNVAIFCAGFEIGSISATIASKVYKRW